MIHGPGSLAVMRFLLSLCVFVTATAAQAMGPWKEACHAAVACTLGDRSYHVLAPDGWDGQSPLPVLLHFHGWARQGDVVVSHQRIAGATRRRGVLLVAPNGLRRSWTFWHPQTRDVPFAAQVLEDVATRYPIDRARLYVSGYSYGGAMAWRYVCENGEGVTALLAVAGSISQSETCPAAPREVRHVHGLDDAVMTFPLGADGDGHFPVALWRARFECGEGRLQGEWQARSWLTFTRTVWDTCAEGRVTLDIHPGGHFIPHGWIARQLDELLGLPPSYP